MIPNALDRATRADVRTEPFPYLVLEDCLPQDLYDALSASYPDDATVLKYSRAGEREKAAANTRHDLSACEVISHPGAVTPLWDEFVRAHVSQAFLARTLELFGPEIRACFPTLEQKVGRPLDAFRAGVRFHPELDGGDISLDCQVGINTPSTRPGSVRRVHTDAVEELFAGLLYFRQPGDTSEGGDLEIYRWADPARKRFLGEAVAEGDARLVASIPYRANTLVMFLNTQDSLHAVSRRSPSPVSRRLVNMVGRMYRKVPEGLFHKPQASTLVKVRERLKSMLAT